MKKYLLLILFSGFSFGQSINTDSLLLEVKKSIAIKDIQKAKEQINLGINNSPEYLDFYLFKAIILNQEKKHNEALITYEHITDKNIYYYDAHLGVINTLIMLNQLKTAQKKLDTAKTIFKNNEHDFNKLQITILKNERDFEKLKDTLIKYNKIYSNDFIYKIELENLNEKYFYNQFGATYNNTFFNRKGIGPWHISSLEYLRKTPKLTFVSRLNYGNRRSFDTYKIFGYQFESEFYLLHNLKSYSFTNVSIGENNSPFPNFKVGYSYFRNFRKDFEYELGIRYINFDNVNLLSSVIGLTYYKNNLIYNLKNYSIINKGYYPSFIFSAKYNKQSNFTKQYHFLIGYGTNPDELFLLGLLNQRKTFQSFRLGIGTKTFFTKKLQMNLQFTCNYQEYIENKYQIEFNTNLSILYKLF